MTEPTPKERALAALREFQKMVPTLSGYARAFTGIKTVRVIPSAGSPRTDGKNIYMQPPLALADRTPHDKMRCGEWDWEGLQECAACMIRHDVLWSTYHEIGHIAEGSFTKLTDYDKTWLVIQAAEVLGDNPRTRGLSEHIEAVVKKNRSSWMAAAGAISPFMPTIHNAFEDGRINHKIGLAKPGVRMMRISSEIRNYRDGVKGSDPVTGEPTQTHYRDMELNHQMAVALYFAAVGHAVPNDLFKPEVMDALEDQRIIEICDEARADLSIRAPYLNALKAFAILRESGFFHHPTDEFVEPPPPPPPAPTREADEEDDEAEPDEDEEPWDDLPDEPDEDDESEDDEGDGESEDDEGDGGDDGEPELDVDDFDIPNENGWGQGDEGSPEEPEDEYDEGGERTDDFEGDYEDEGGEGEPPSDTESDLDESRNDSDRTNLDPEPGITPGNEDSTEPEEGDDEPSGDGDLADDGEPSGDEPEGLTDEGDGSESGEGNGSADGDDGTEGEGDEEEEDDGALASGTENVSEGDRLSDPDGDDEGAGDGTDGQGDGTDERDWGTEEGADSALNDVLGHHHGDESDALPEGTTAEEMARIMEAVISGSQFDTIPQAITSVRVHREDAHGTRDGIDQALAWTHAYDSRLSRRDWGIDPLEGDTFDPPESVIGSSLLQARLAFSANRRTANMRNLKAGKVDRNVLGKRAPIGDPRLFHRKLRPEKRDYFVLLGMDVSGSSMGHEIRLMKKCVMAEAEVLQRLGVKFAVYGHSGKYVGRWGHSDLGLDIYEVKSADEPWNNTTRHRLTELGPDNCNLDGHTLEFYRKILDERRETDRVIQYYTDGAMPLENFDEELAVLQSNIKICKDRGYHLMAVGCGTDSPQSHGFDTVRIDEVGDVAKVVQHLGRRLQG
ncbi:hypothetical protein ACFV42_49250 [Streptomyces solisilvae]|uniref:cobaltochelatase CobT-related protein n=1 Tax=Streptomyces malaysiensis TaxID=92644 RepID=UPI00369707E9